MNVMPIKPKFLASMGYHIFLTMVLCACVPNRAPLKIDVLLFSMESKL